MGFLVYHRNRLIKCMWEPYSSASSIGRGVLGILEVDFVQPAHDKQDFERTDLFARLEAKLKQLQPAFWRAEGANVGYQPSGAAKPAALQNQPSGAAKPTALQSAPTAGAAPDSSDTPAPDGCSRAARQRPRAEPQRFEPTAQSDLRNLREAGPAKRRRVSQTARSTRVEAGVGAGSGEMEMEVDAELDSEVDAEELEVEELEDDAAARNVELDSRVRELEFRLGEQQAELVKLRAFRMSTVKLLHGLGLEGEIVHLEGGGAATGGGGGTALSGAMGHRGQVLPGPLPAAFEHTGSALEVEYVD